MRITYYAILKEIVLVFGAVRSTPKKIQSTPNEKKANVRIKITSVRIVLEGLKRSEKYGAFQTQRCDKIRSVAHKKYAHKMRKSVYTKVPYKVAINLVENGVSA